jgi:penicillin-binding protein 1A
MKGALETALPTPFRIPPGIDLVPINRITGASAPLGQPTTILEAFKAGTEPGVAVTDETNNLATPGQGPATDVDQGTGGLY